MIQKRDRQNHETKPSETVKQQKWKWPRSNDRTKRKKKGKESMSADHELCLSKLFLNLIKMSGSLQPGGRWADLGDCENVIVPPLVVVVVVFRGDWLPSDRSFLETIDLCRELTIGSCRGEGSWSLRNPNPQTC